MQIGKTIDYVPKTLQLKTNCVKALEPVVSDGDRPEFIGQIIDIFEDFLESKGIDIENPEKAEDPDSEAIIYGTDYCELESRLEKTLINWGILGKEM